MIGRLAVLAVLPALALALPGPAGAEAMKGRYELRCQDPRTRQWSVAGRLLDPEIVDRPGGGREARGREADGAPVVLPMPADRTCMLNAS